MLSVDYDMFDMFWADIFGLVDAGFPLMFELFSVALGLFVLYQLFGGSADLILPQGRKFR